MATGQTKVASAAEDARRREFLATVPMWAVTLIANERLVPGLREIRVGGLDGFEPAGPDVFFHALVWPDGSVDETYTMGRYLDGRGDSPVRGAYYTLRHWEPTTSTVTFWVVEHEHDGSVAAWMRDARAGDRLLLWGPRQGFAVPSTDRVLLCADETGYAAVARMIEALPDTCQAIAVLETAGGPRPAMPPGADYRWVRRAGAPGTGDGMLDEVRTLPLDANRWTAFGAAESRQATRVRRHLRDERGFARDQVSMVGYWRAT